MAAASAVPEMAERVAAFDWAGTPLGARERWSPALRGAVHMMLAMRQPAAIYWGPGLIGLYNDGYRTFLGPDRHPGCLGRPASETWAEAWDRIGEPLAEAMRGGSVWHEELCIPDGAERRERWWSYGCSPIPGESGPGGVLVLAQEVTAVRRDREALRDSERRFAAIAQTGLLGVAECVDGRVVFANEALLSMLGATGTDVADARLCCPAPMPASRAAGVAAGPRAEIELPRLDGGRVPVLLASVPVGHDPGRLLCAAVDLTAVRRSEAALRASEERLRLAQEAAGLGIHVYDATTDSFEWDARLRELWGIGPEVRITRDVFAAGCHPDDLPRVRAAFHRALDPAGDGRYEAEYRVTSARDGLTRRIRAIGRTTFADGRALRLVGTVEDVTAARTATEQSRDALEARVAAATAERNSMWRISQDLFVVSGTDGVFRSANPAWLRVLGRAPEEVAGRLHTDLIHPDDRERAVAEHATLVAGGLVRDLELRFLHADGSARWISWSAVKDGDLLYAVGRDITEQREAAAALRRAQHELNQVQKLETIGQLTGGVAHDFNNLLAAILANLDLLRKRVGDDPRLGRFVSAAIQGAERGAALTSRLLAFARKQELHAAPVQVGALLQGMEELIRRSLGPGIDLLIDVPDSLPPARVDTNQLELALLNLTVNARDAMPQGGTLAFFATAATHPPDGPRELRPGRFLRLTVADTGIGMDEETARRALEPFFTTKGVGKGTGLGLSMVHGLALQSGGALTLQSRPQEGTAVTLWLPMAEAEMTQPPIDTSPSNAPASDRARVVLVVDDDVLVSMGTVAMLEDLGHVVLDASSGRQALEVLAARPDIEVMITDHAMPGMTGTELARRAKTARPDLPVILATGYAELPNGEEPGLPRLPKPFFQQDIVRVLGEVLGG
ncbi:MAG: PAS domain-containing protein [Acetobacteraceae bacterium]|nr:PAS domain-containing protein [Acetobacteraceae bacterium]